MPRSFPPGSFEKSFIKQQLLNYCFIGIGSLIAFFFTSLVLSGMALKPIAKAWKQQQQFIADASHELKTPITVMLANTSILLSAKKHDKKQVHKWISYIDLEAKRMKKLVEDLLFLARVDSKEKLCLHTRISLSDVVTKSTLPFEAVMFESGKQLCTNIKSNIYINGDIGQIRQLVFILLDNARKYAVETSAVTVSLTKENKKTTLSIHNLAKPLSDISIAHIFDRFYRVDEARTREKGSYGLGLSIAKEIVDSHNEKLSVISDEETGTTFTATFSAISN